MQIPRVTPEMQRTMPDQFCETINMVIDWVNKQQKNNPR